MDQPISPESQWETLHQEQQTNLTKRRLKRAIKPFKQEFKQSLPLVNRQ